MQSIPEEGLVKKTWYGKKKVVGTTKFSDEKIYRPKRLPKEDGPASNPDYVPVDHSKPNNSAMELLFGPDEAKGAAGAAKKAETSGASTSGHQKQMTLADLFKHEDMGTGPFAPPV